ncbi:MAG: tripartite tricarboxylate transporter substrate binding protein [Sphaerochaetaceae bacterium]|nr:tripartite tricarboxylate transporter substrate binding protein [Sphaerochaetaceae bacterium]
MKKIINMTVLFFVFTVLVTAGLAAAGTEEQSSSAAVKQWPSGAVTIISPSRAGGFADIHSRILADYLQRTTGVPFAVVNQSDGGGNIGSDTVRYAEPDGRTLLHFHTSFPIAAYTGVYDGDPKKDFTVLAATQTGGYHVFITRADAPYSTIEELVQYARANPESVKWGAAAGVTSHFMMALLEREADVKFRMLDAGNEAERVTAMLGGFIDVTNMGINGAHQHALAGNMKILGVIGDKRDKNLTQYPTIREQGYDVAWAGAFGLYGPAGMDPALVTMINEALKGYGEDEKAKEALDKMGSDFTYMNVEESQAYYFKQFNDIESLAEEFGF